MKDYMERDYVWLNPTSRYTPRFFIEEENPDFIESNFPDYPCRWIKGDYDVVMYDQEEGLAVVEYNHAKALPQTGRQRLEPFRAFFNGVWRTRLEIEVELLSRWAEEQSSGVYLLTNGSLLNL